MARQLTEQLDREVAAADISREVAKAQAAIKTSFDPQAPSSIPPPLPSETVTVAGASPASGASLAAQSHTAPAAAMPAPAEPAAAPSSPPAPAASTSADSSPAPDPSKHGHE